MLLYQVGEGCCFCSDPHHVRGGEEGCGKSVVLRRLMDGVQYGASHHVTFVQWW